MIGTEKKKFSFWGSIKASSVTPYPCPACLLTQQQRAMGKSSPSPVVRTWQSPSGLSSQAAFLQLTEWPIKLRIKRQMWQEATQPQSPLHYFEALSLSKTTALSLTPEFTLPAAPVEEPGYASGSFLPKHTPFARHGQTLMSELDSQHTRFPTPCRWALGFPPYAAPAPTAHLSRGSAQPCAAPFNSSQTSSVPCWALTNFAVASLARSFASSWEVCNSSSHHRFDFLLFKSQYSSIIKLLQKKMQFLELKKKKKKGTGGTGDGLLKLPQSILLAACCPL